MKTVLVCGGAGYIGSHTVHYLNRAGYRTLVFDSLISGYRQDMLGHVNVVGDLCDPFALSEVFRCHRIDAVVHFASFIAVGESVREPYRYYKNNLVGLLNLLEAMRQASVGHLVFSSSAAVYGQPQSSPITETDSIAPLSPYGHSKAMGEQMIQDFAKASDLRYVALRYFNACGKDPETALCEKHIPETHLIPLAIGAIDEKYPPLTVFGTDYPTRDGTCIRDYVHVSDLAQAHEQAIQYLLQGKPSQAMNLGNGSGYTVLEVIQAIESEFSKPVPHSFGPRREGDPAVLVASADKAKKLLGWSPRYQSLLEIVRTLR